MARPLEFDKEDVVSRAVCVFLRHGYEAASVDDLTRELSISRASLYNSFGDKRGLLLAALDCAAQKGEQYRQKLRQSPGAPDEAVEKFFRGLVKDHLEGTAPAGCIFLTVGAELSGADEAVAVRVKGNLDAHRENFRAVLSRNAAWKPKERARMADALLASMLGLLVLVRVYPEPAVLEAAIQQSIEILKKVIQTASRLRRLTVMSMKHSLMGLILAGSLWGQHEGARPARIVPRIWPGYGELRFEVRSQSVEARKWANQGLRLVYAFNHPEAVASFRKATELDAECALCWWGLSFALGNNINAPLMPENAGPAYEAAQRALAAGEKGSAREKAYVAALAQRYAKENPADRSALDKAYALAMREVAKKFPDDLDAQVLAADALMNLTPWKLWDRKGKPNQYTLELVELLESVLARDPRHLGANHFYIHAVEASKTPERALPSAALLASLAPGSGHLVHMPSHIFMRVGDYEEAARLNAKAAQLDQAYFRLVAGPTYYLPYWVHNSNFFAAARSMQGRYAEGRLAIGEAARNLEPLARMMADFEPFLAAPLLYEVRFQKWDKILALPEPASFSLSVNNVWHFARGMALAGKGKPEAAREELAKFRKSVEALAEGRSFGLNKERAVMEIAVRMLEAKIALAGNDLPEAARLLQLAVAGEDALSYDEPADWYYPPTREALGAVLLRMGDFPAAERVFRAELENNRRSGRAYFGLREALKGQKRDEEAAMVEPLYLQAWAKADRPVSLEQLF